MRCSQCRVALESNALFCGHCGQRTRLRADSRNGSVIDDRYRIEATIARGGFGSVYRALHLASNVEVAIKILHPDLAADPTLRPRFARESATLAKLRSPHTVITYQRGETRDGTLYIVMELLHGETLQARLERCRRLAWRDVLAIMRAVCRSLAEAHACGIIHRDLKPANIHLGAEDFVKVLDFGVAKLLPWSGIDDLELTAVGETIGTLEYMAPELLVGADCDPRTDLYALGVTAYQSLVGKLPFADCSNAAALVTAALTQTPDPVSASCLVPMQVDRLVTRCLESDPARRFTSAVELATAIDRILHGGAHLLAMPLQGGRP